MTNEQRLEKLLNAYHSTDAVFNTVKALQTVTDAFEEVIADQIVNKHPELSTGYNKAVEMQKEVAVAFGVWYVWNQNGNYYGPDAYDYFITNIYGK